MRPLARTLLLLLFILLAAIGKDAPLRPPPRLRPAAPPLPAGPVKVDALPANTWVQADPADGTPAFSPGLVWSKGLRRFICFAGQAAHDFKGQRPYDVQSFDLAAGYWANDLPAGAEKRGGVTGPVTEPGYATPWFALKDKDGLVRPHPHHGCLWYQYALAPWDGSIYSLICGHLLRYDPGKRQWQELKGPGDPIRAGNSAGETLCWGALCADPVNREVVLFGGCGLRTVDSSPGTWVYSTEKDQWQDLKPAVQPGPRALAPLAFDPASKKIILFGGDRLDQLYADTWAYDCATRTWAECKPAGSPSPRFGHALLALPKAGKVLLVGGKDYRSVTDYCAMLYKPLPLEMWAYDVAKNDWSLVARFENQALPLSPVEAAAAAVNDDDVVMLLGTTGRRYEPHTTWLCRVDAARADAAATAKFAVKPQTVECRTGPFDPEWYSQDVPAADPAAVETFFKNLPANQWQAIKCPKWPLNRQGGGWSTVTLDTDRDRILHIGGGHSSYFGNDWAIYDIKTGRWSISWRPAFALEFNYGLNGPGYWAFNGAPWGNHNYHAYAYDPTIQRVVYIKLNTTVFYDPAANAWMFRELLADPPFLPSKYTSYLCPTPAGVVAWAQLKDNSGRCGLWRLEAGKAWKPLATSGDPLPSSVCDGSTISYDAKRDRLVLTTTVSQKSGEPAGQVWGVELKTGAVRKLSPAGADAIKGERFAREAAYLPKGDLVMIGFLLEVGGRMVMPFYDCAENQWLSADVPGSEFINAKGKPGSSVDLGLVYDPKRDAVWGVLCNLHPGALNVIRVDREKLGLTPLK